MLLKLGNGWATGNSAGWLPNSLVYLQTEYMGDCSADTYVAAFNVDIKRKREPPTPTTV